MLSIHLIQTVRAVCEQRCITLNQPTAHSFVERTLMFHAHALHVHFYFILSHNNNIINANK